MSLVQHHYLGQRGFEFACDMPTERGANWPGPPHHPGLSSQQDVFNRAIMFLFCRVWRVTWGILLLCKTRVAGIAMQVWACAVELMAMWVFFFFFSKVCIVKLFLGYRIVGGAVCVMAWFSFRWAMFVVFVGSLRLLRVSLALLSGLGFLLLSTKCPGKLWVSCRQSWRPLPRGLFKARRDRLRCRRPLEVWGSHILRAMTART